MFLTSLSEDPLSIAIVFPLLVGFVLFTPGFRHYCRTNKGLLGFCGDTSMCFAPAVAIDMVEVLLKSMESLLMSTHHFLRTQRIRALICEVLREISDH